MEVKYNILVIDDEMQIINSIRRVLNDSKYRVEYTTTPEDAYEILLSNDFDLVLCDQRMPGTAGVEILKFIKKFLPDTVRILITGYSDINAVVSAVNEGSIFKYVSKPWDNEKLLEVVESAIAYREEKKRKEEVYIQQWEAAVDSLKKQVIDGRERAVKSLLKVMEAKDAELLRHCERVSRYALAIADKMNLSEKQKINLKYAAVLHDVGKITIKDKVMYKPGKLEFDEFTEVTSHPIVGSEIVKTIDGMNDAAEIILQHHEKLNGRGYPRGLRETEILIEAKILAVADTYDALTSDRIYRKALNPEEAYEIIMNERNSSYDSDIINILIGGTLSE
jgi:putative two-component system response regulator